jgi:hypothetical protein
MSSLIQGNPWVWVVVQEEISNEQYVGQKEEQTGVSFIPAFLSKEEAQKGYHLLKREKGRKAEVQAVRYKELAKDAAGNGFMIFVVDGEGDVKEKIDPRS